MYFLDVLDVIVIAIIAIFGMLGSYEIGRWEGKRAGKREEHTLMEIEMIKNKIDRG